MEAQHPAAFTSDGFYLYGCLPSMLRACMNSEIRTHAASLSQTGTPRAKPPSQRLKHHCSPMCLSPQSLNTTVSSARTPQRAASGGRLKQSVTWEWRSSPAPSPRGSPPSPSSSASSPLSPSLGRSWPSTRESPSSTRSL